MEAAVRPYAKAPKIRIGTKGMFAQIRFASPGPGEDVPHLSSDDVIVMLKNAGITYGIDEGMVSSLCENMLFDTDITIAVGKEATAGENGYFEYHFNEDFSKKPTIRPDGTADFLSIKIIEIVHEGDLIATYHPAVPGKDGINVQGKPVEPKVVRDMPPLSGRGFSRSEDNLQYFSLMDGKIVRENNRIMISPVYEIDRDADMTVGNIDFKGDVVIHGGVKHGIRIHATGSITVDGLVEHCDMRAGKDIFLLSGVKGAERTKIHAEGNITADFIEYAVVFCKGHLRADVLFNCFVNCESKVVVTSGKKSAIIGGYVTAIQGISVLRLGNKFGTVTHVIVGVDEERLKEVFMLSQKINAIESNINKIKKGIEDFDAAALKKIKDYKNDPRRMQLLRVKIQEEAKVAQDRMRLDELKEILSKGKNATIKVYDTVYSGVTVKMTEQYVQISDYQKKIEFVKTTTGIRMEPLDEPIPEE